MPYDAEEHPRGLRLACDVTPLHWSQVSAKEMFGGPGYEACRCASRLNSRSTVAWRYRGKKGRDARLNRVWGYCGFG